MAQAVQNLPPGYQPAWNIDLSKDQRLLVILNIAGLVLLVLFGGLFLRAMFWLRPEEARGSLWSLNIHGLGGWAVYLGSILALMAFHIVLHEAIHGVFFWIFTGSRPKFALRLTYAYAAAPGWFIRRNAFLVTALAPFIAITLGGLLLLRFSPWLLPAWFVMTINAAGSVGDLLIAGRLLWLDPSSLVEDRGDAVTIYAPGEEKI